MHVVSVAPFLGYFVTIGEMYHFKFDRKHFISFKIKKFVMWDLKFQFSTLSKFVLLVVLLYVYLKKKYAFICCKAALWIWGRALHLFKYQLASGKYECIERSHVFYFINCEVKVGIPRLKLQLLVLEILTLELQFRLSQNSELILKLQDAKD